MIEGVAIPDNREERFEELARDFVNGPLGLDWEKVPLPAREALLDYLRDCFHWAIEQT